MRGLCLPGGGAKGAFQAGVILGLWENGIGFDILAGTSIGAINGYYIYSGQVEALRDLWTNMDFEAMKHDKILDIVIENTVMMKKLEELKLKRLFKGEFFVNYAKVAAGKLKEEVVNIAQFESKKEQLEAIKGSSLLPIRMDKPMSFNDIIENFSSKKAFEDFKEDLSTGKYEGYNLDGGIFNPQLLSPFQTIDVKEIYIIPLKKDYELPKEYEPLKTSKKLVILDPDFEFSPGDTLRFERDFCREVFERGYQLVKNI